MSFLPPIYSLGPAPVQQFLSFFFSLLKGPALYFLFDFIPAVVLSFGRQGAAAGGADKSVNQMSTRPFSNRIPSALKWQLLADYRQIERHSPVSFLSFSFLSFQDDGQTLRQREDQSTSLFNSLKIIFNCKITIPTAFN